LLPKLRPKTDNTHLARIRHQYAKNRKSFDEAADKSPIVASMDMRIVLSMNGAAALLLGILPGTLMAACVNAIYKTLTT